MVQALTIAVAYVIPGVTVRPMETVAISVVTDAVVHLETPVLPTIPPSIHVAVATLLALATIRRARLAAPLPALLIVATIRRARLAAPLPALLIVGLAAATVRVIVEVAITLPALAPVRRVQVPILLPALAPVRRAEVPIALLALAVIIVAVVALLPVLTIVGPAATMLAIVTQSICKATLISLEKM